MGFYILWENQDAMPLLRVGGELDIANSPRLREVLLVALSGGAASIRLDLSRLEFIDSSGLTVLVTAQKETAARGGHVQLLGVSDRVRRLLQLIQVEDQFSFGAEAEPRSAAAGG
jgi:anti-sigma B factor antagonist